MPRATKDTKQTTEKKEKLNTKKTETKKAEKKRNTTTEAIKKVKTTKTPKESTSKSVKTKQTKLSVSDVPIKAKKGATTKNKLPTQTPKQPTKKVEVLEYYDLPYRYNETIVKLLYQTPTTLFVYWDISDEDKQKYIKQYGEYFFYNTKPVLIVKNKTLHYQYEVEINDFANSWYLQVNDSKCVYEIELGRKAINQYVTIPNNYLPVTTSNDIESPNDHVLIENLKPEITFQNVKTHQYYTKPFNPLSLEKIYKKQNITVKKFYQKMYKTAFVDAKHFDLHNPSSGNPTSTFK